MDRARKIVIVSVLVAFLVIIGYCAQIGSYTSDVQRDWSGLQKSLVELDSSVKSKSCDFSDIEQKTSQLKSIIDQRKNAYATRSIPLGFGTFNYYFVDFLTKTSNSLDLICKNCVTWEGSKLSELRQNSEEMRNSQLECVNNWRGIRGLQANNEIFAHTESILNGMHEDRAPKKVPIPVVAEAPLIYQPSISAANFNNLDIPSVDPTSRYLGIMRAYLREYKRQRSEFDITITPIIEYIKKNGKPPADSNYYRILENARDSRTAVINQMKSLTSSVPSSDWAIRHREAIDCVEYGKSAVVSLIDGHYDTFHEISQKNTPILKQVMRNYGIDS